MGLSLVVGVLAELFENNEEGAESVRGEMEIVNRALRAAGLPEYREPEEVIGWSCDMIGYSGLHYLRRIAAHVDSGGGLPNVIDGDDNPADDPVLKGYYDATAGRKPSLMNRLFGGGRKYARGFDHLIVHSDAVGFYVPIDFSMVLFREDDGESIGYMVGSSHRLLSECLRLRAVLEIPDGIDENSEELWQAVDERGEGEATWQRYGVESHACVCLIEACKRSIAQGAVIAFC